MSDNNKKIKNRYDRIAPIYDMIESIMEKSKMGKWRSQLWGKLMDTFNWISLYTWGANINRETMKNIDKANLKIVEVNDLLFDVVKEIILSP